MEIQDMIEQLEEKRDDLIFIKNDLMKKYQKAPYESEEEDMLYMKLHNKMSQISAISNAIRYLQDVEMDKDIDL